MINIEQHDALLAAAMRAFTSKSPVDEQAFCRLLVFFTEGCDAKTVAMRTKFAPRILAALLSVPGAHNDDKEVAHAVSLSDKLARAIVTQPQ
jgi:hypothetical protein